MKKLVTVYAVLLVLPLMAIAGTLPDTGQTKCYDDVGNEINPCPQPGEPFYGQDANYAPRNPHSYTDLGNGIVRDNVTGLEWQQDGPPETSWQQAIDYCDNLVLGGHDDWRLPTIKELSTLVNVSILSHIDSEYFPNTYEGRHWSSTNNARFPDSAWQVDFRDGSMDGGALLYFDFEVMAVRGGQSGPFDDLFNLEDNRDGTVTDLETGLMWQQDTAPGTYTWGQALSYCENLKLGGYRDWRLPNRNELQSIIDYSRFTPSIDAVFNAESTYYWTSTTYTTYDYVVPYAWVVSFDDGQIICCGGKGSPLGYVRAVRSVQNGPLCPIELIYGEHSAQTKRLRHFRDTILSKTSEGQELIKLYYLWSPVLVKAMEGDEEFRQEVKRMIDSVLPMIGKDILAQ